MGQRMEHDGEQEETLVHIGSHCPCPAPTRACGAPHTFPWLVPTCPPLPSPWLGPLPSPAPSSTVLSSGPCPENAVLHQMGLHSDAGLSAEKGITGS